MPIRIVGDDDERNYPAAAAENKAQRAIVTEAPARRLELCNVFIDKDTVLGRGPSSVVYAGTLYGHRQVAVKVIEVVRKGALQRVKDEIRRAMNLSRHKNVVRVFGIVTFEDETSVGVVMERLGESLEKVKMDDASLRMKYTLDIIAGMEYMHAPADACEVRFGLRPANILLADDDRSVKIIDLGVAQTVDKLAPGAIASIHATLRFVAPELFAEKLEPSSACDVYSFAVILAELWTGTVAWHGTPEDQIPAAVVEGKRPFSPQDLKTLVVPGPITALIVACWAQCPHLRPTFARPWAGLQDIPNFHEAPQETVSKLLDPPY
jgi:serine/threonine protein kinase